MRRFCVLLVCGYILRCFSDELVGWWKFDEERGDVAFDSSGNDNHGFVNGAQRGVPGKRGGALLFDGKDDYVLIPKSRTLDTITKEITLMAWVKTPIAHRHSLFDRWLYGGEEGADQRSFELTVERDGGVSFGLAGKGTGGPWMRSKGKVPRDVWTHITATSDGKTMKIYINGKLDATKGNAPPRIHVSTGNLHIGCWYAEGAWDTAFKGLIDEARIYNRALSAQEIAKIYEEESKTTETAQAEKQKILRRTFHVSLKGNDKNDGLSWKNSFRTISKAVSVATAGDTVIIASGDYGNESAVVANTGLPDAPITIKADEPGKVVLKGAGGGAGLTITNKSYIIVEGLKFANYSAGLSIRYNCSYITVRRCVFVENNSVGLSVRGNKGNPQKCHHILITENEFYDFRDKQDYGVYLYFCSYVKVVNNYLFGWHHQTVSAKKLVFNSLFSHNIFEGYRYTALFLGQNLDNDDEGILRSHNLVAEYNLFRPASRFRAKRSIAISNVTNAVVRYNFIEGTDRIGRDWGEGIGIFVNATNAKVYGNVIAGVAGTTANPAIRIYSNGEGYGHAQEHCKNIKLFNNTIVKCACNLGYDKSPGEVYYKNNIFYMPTRGMFREDGRYLVNSRFEHNDFYPDWKGKRSGGISADPLFVAEFTPLKLGGVNPRFTPDFSRAEPYRLRRNSPCIDKGTHLTTTVGAGKGKEIKLEDASYFTDGFGIAEPDFIQVGSNKPVRIVKVDYKQSIVTVEREISWKDSDGVSLPFSGTAPDIGAYEFVGSGSVSGVVLDAHKGTPIKGALITDGRRKAVTNAQGKFTLPYVPAGVYNLTCRSTGYKDSTRQNVEVKDGAKLRIDFKLEALPRGTIKGKVQDHKKNPVAGAIVFATGAQQFIAKTDKRGDFTMAEVPYGVYRLECARPGYEPVIFRRVEVGGEKSISFALPQEKHLVVHLKFNEGGGAVAKDSSGFGNRAMLKGPFKWVDGISGKAVEFDGKTSYAELPPSESLNSITRDIGITVWIKTDFFQRGAIVENWFYDKTVKPEVGERAYYCGVVQGGGFDLGLSGERGQWLSTPKTFKPEAWHFVAFTSDGLNMRIYVDGELAVESVVAPSSIHISHRPIHIGAWNAKERNAPPFSAFLKGILDELRIYKRALTHADVLALYKIESQNK